MASTDALLQQIDFLNARVLALQTELDKAKIILKEILDDYETD